MASAWSPAAKKYAAQHPAREGIVQKTLICRNGNREIQKLFWARAFPFPLADSRIFGRSLQRLGCQPELKNDDRIFRSEFYKLSLRGSLRSCGMWDIGGTFDIEKKSFRLGLVRFRIRAILPLLYGMSSVAGFAVPKVSICIPVYNVEPWLPAALDSARDQTLEDIEIICVDDGSTDGSLAVLKSYAEKDPRIKVLENGENLGTLYTRIRSICASQGKYIIPLDSDDELFLDIAEKAYNAAENEEVDIVFFRTKSVGPNGKRPSAQKGPNVPSTAKARSTKGLISLVGESKMSWRLWGRLWRGELIRSVAANWLDFARNNHIVYKENAFLFYFTVRKATSCVSLGDIGYVYYRAHGGVSSRRGAAARAKRQADIATVRKIIAEDKPDVPGKEKFLNRLRKNSPREPTPSSTQKNLLRYTFRTNWARETGSKC
ncbi:MAG: glycosyltransferase [Puniceicoccales bacterium]|nr:glycosyltransferase [Puniceicoccales bacterium]